MPFQQDLDAQTLPTVDMDVDGDEYVVDPAESEKEDVMILTPEDVPDQVESVLMADNCKCSIKHVESAGLTNRQMMR
jgi:hypothetical protein